MPTYHDAVAAVPVSGQPNKTLMRGVMTARVPYVLADADDLQNITATDPDVGSVIIDVLFLGRIFHFDAADTTTLHDGTTCLVSADGLRYKLQSQSDVFAWSVLDNTVATPPGSPSLGDAYLVAAAATGAWAGHDGAVTVYTARGWEFISFGVGRFIYVEAGTNADTFYHKNAAGSWVAGFGNQSLSAGSVSYAASINFGNFSIVENQTTNTPPASPTVGQAYVIGPSPTGSWAGHAAKLAICNVAGSFTITSPPTGYRVYDKAQATDYRFNGSSWISASGRWKKTVRLYLASTTWTKPSRFFGAQVWLYGPGGGGSNNAGNGGDGSGASLFGTSLGANPGLGGLPGGTLRTGGTSSGGDHNLNGGDGVSNGVGGASPGPYGGGAAYAGSNGKPYGGGGGGSGGGGGGSAGGACGKWFNDADIPTNVAITIGTAGANGGAGSGAGSNGACIVEEFTEV